MPVKILGIVNMTEDSFSDGGRYLDTGRAIDHAWSLTEAGADVIDLGPASSHPDSKDVSAQEEIDRLGPVIAALHREGVAVSVDSFQLDTQRFAVEQGVAYLNDIRGFPDSRLYDQLARADCELIVMHSIQGRGRATRDHGSADTVLDDIPSFFKRRLGELEAAGIEAGRIILDPGMGFFLGAAPEPSIRVLRSVGALRGRCSCPLLISVSRKSFLGEVTQSVVADRGAATLAAELHAVRQGASYIRTHDVRALRDGLLVEEALTVA